MALEQSLFRQTAVVAAAGSQVGEALAVHWRGVQIFICAAVSLLLGLTIFLATVQYAPIHRVPCYTDVRNGLARLTAAVSGQVVRLAVSEGTLVRGGDLLAVLSGDVLRADGGSEQVELQRTLLAERTMIDGEVRAAEEEAMASHAVLERRLVGLQLERGQLQAELSAAERLRQSLQTQAEKVAELLQQGFATQLAQVQKRDEVTSQESRVASVAAALTRVERDIAIATAETRLVDARRAGAVESRRRAAGELERLIVRSEAEAQRVIRAPVEGTVSTALIALGQSVAPGQALFTIAPLGEPLVLRLLIPARAAASVRPHMQVKLVFSAYPQEKFGAFVARVDTVSDAPSLPADVQRMLPVTEPVFIATALLPQPLLGPDGRALTIKPGMLAEALVPVERRTLLEWIFEPFMRGFRRAAPQPEQPT